MEGTSANVLLLQGATWLADMKHETAMNLLSAWALLTVVGQKHCKLFRLFLLEFFEIHLHGGGLVGITSSFRICCTVVRIIIWNKGSLLQKRRSRRSAFSTQLRTPGPPLSIERLQHTSKTADNRTPSRTRGHCLKFAAT